MVLSKTRKPTHLHPGTLAAVLAALLFAGSLVSAREPAGAEGARQDFYGDPLPRHALARLGTVRFRPLTDVWAMDLSADGKWIATGTFPGSMHNEVEVWDAATGKKVASMLAGTNNIICLAFSPDGKQLAVSHDQRVEIFDVETRKLRKKLQAEEAAENADRSFWSLSWSPHGTYLAAAVPKDKTAWLWDAKTGKRVDTNTFTTEPACVAFSPDEKHLVIGGEWFLYTIDVSTGKLERTLELPSSRVDAGGFSPDGKALVLGLSSIATNTTIKRAEKDGWADDLGAKHRKSRIVMIGADGTKIRELQVEPYRFMGSVRFAPDGKTVFATGFSGPLAAWDVATGKLRYQTTAEGYVGRSFGLSADGRVLATAGRRISVWNAATGETLSPQTSHGNSLFRLHLLKGGKTVVSGGADRTLRFWDVKSGRPMSLYGADWMWGGAFAISPDDKLVAVGGGNSVIRLVDRESLKELGRLRLAVRAPPLGGQGAFLGGVTFLAFLPDGQLISTTGYGAVDLWDVASRRHAFRFVERDVPVMSVASSPDGTTLAIPHGYAFGENPDSTVELWDVAARRRGRTLPAMNFIFYVSTALSPDGKRIVTGFPNKAVDFPKPKEHAFLRLWDCSKGDASGPRRTPSAFLGNWHSPPMGDSLPPLMNLTTTGYVFGPPPMATSCFGLKAT
jgi:WD40 repeat protein